MNKNPIKKSQNSCCFYAPVIYSERMKVLLHFFPNLGPLSTPSPVTCRVSIFGQGRISAPIALEGLRLSQADTIPLSALFSDFSRDYGHLAGLCIELSGTRGLQASQVFIEMRSTLGSSKFLARTFVSPVAPSAVPACAASKSQNSEQAPQENPRDVPSRLLPMCFDSNQIQKMIFLNPSESALRVGTSVLAPMSVLEMPCHPETNRSSSANAGNASYTQDPRLHFSGMLAGVAVPDSAALSFLFSCDRSTHIPFK